MTGWPVGTVSAGVVGTAGVLDTVGDLDAPYPWASVTKVLVALAVLVATEEGTLDLDDPAGPPGSTVRHLLAHASGLAPDSDQVLAAPGRRRIYSNRGFEVLADTVAERADMDFTDYLRAGVVLPLSLTGTDLPVRSSPASGARGPLRDLLLLAGELLEPRLVSRSTLAAATTVAFPGLPGVLPGFGPFDPCDWGLGFELRDAKAPHWTGTHNSPATFGHFGRSGGFIWVDPVAEVACAALTDRAFGPWARAAWPVLADAVLAWQGVRAPGTAGPLP